MCKSSDHRYDVIQRVQFISHLEKNNVNLRVFHPIYKNRNQPKKKHQIINSFLKLYIHILPVAVSNKLEVCQHLLDQVARQGLFTDRLFSQGEPELTSLQGHIFIRVLGPLQHVLLREENGWWYWRGRERRRTLFLSEFKPFAHLDDAVHVWNEAVNADLQKHDQSPAHILPHFTVLVTRQCEQTLVNRKRKGDVEKDVAVRQS